MSVGLRWATVIVHQKVSGEQMAALATALHNQYPEIRYDIFDATAQRSAIVRFEQHKIADREDLFDEKWVEGHHIGKINLVSISNTERQWQLMPGMSDLGPLLNTINLDLNSTRLSPAPANAAGGANAKPDLSDREKAKLARKYSIRAAELIAMYEANEVAADNLLKGNPVVVKGRVDKIGKDILLAPYISMGRAPYGLTAVHCSFNRKNEHLLVDLRPGREIFVMGKVQGKMMNVLLDDCEIVP
ncbi:hypothetical protein F183_A17480 [Bryobacterales bacterium F-183]|nr:hypothetical protein F183_A17480 [Bryobacterales bacterium F-183]